MDIFCCGGFDEEVTDALSHKHYALRKSQACQIVKHREARE